MTTMTLSLRVLLVISASLSGVGLCSAQTQAVSTSQTSMIVGPGPDLQDCLSDRESKDAHVATEASQYVIPTAYRSEQEYESAIYTKAMYPILRQYAWMDYMMYWKYLYGMIYGGPRPHDNPFQTTSDQLDKYLQSVLATEKPAGILVYWRSLSAKRCVGLVLPGKQMLVEASPTDPRPLSSLLPDLPTSQNARVARLRTASGSDVKPSDNTISSKTPPDLSGAALQLVPGTIAAAIAGGRVRSLLVLPIEDIGTIPFAALPVNTSNDPLITFTTVTLGDELFIRYPSGTASPPLKIVHHAVIVGDPDLSKDPKWFFPDLPGARQEAIDVGSLVGVHPLLGAAATHVAVLNALKRPQSLDLIYIATHAITDRANPQDGSFLALAGGDLLTREVEKLKLTGRPLVILSACQTGLGKEFDGGIFGMAFSWHLSGAGTVVTSLWNVDDEATHDLMTDFVARMKDESPSRAMAETMRHRLESDPDYRNWASFVVYGNLPTAPVSVTKTTPIATKRLQR